MNVIVPRFSAGGFSMRWRHVASQSAARGRSLELAVVGYQPESSQSEVRKPDEPAEKRLLTATSPSQK